jgi:hypothetical protein
MQRLAARLLCHWNGCIASTAQVKEAIEKNTSGRRETDKGNRQAGQ